MWINSRCLRSSPSHACKTLELHWLGAGRRILGRSLAKRVTCAKSSLKFQILYSFQTPLESRKGYIKTEVSGMTKREKEEQEWGEEMKGGAEKAVFRGNAEWSGRVGREGLCSKGAREKEVQTPWMGDTMGPSKFWGWEAKQQVKSKRTQMQEESSISEKKEWGKLGKRRWGQIRRKWYFFLAVGESFLCAYKGNCLSLENLACSPEADSLSAMTCPVYQSSFVCKQAIFLFT